MFNVGNLSPKMWKELRVQHAEHSMNQSKSAIAFSLSASSVNSKPVLQSMFPLTPAVPPLCLRDRESSSQAAWGEDMGWVLICGRPQWPSWGRQCQAGGDRLVFPAAHFHCHWWHPDIAWVWGAGLQFNTGCDSRISLCSVFKLTIYLDFKKHFCNLSLCISA